MVPQLKSTQTPPIIEPPNPEPADSSTTPPVIASPEALAEPAKIAGRAIVTFGRGWHSLAVVRSLASRGVEVISADVYGLTPGALSSASVDSFTYPDPNTDPEGFLDALEQEVRERRPAPGVPYVLQPVQQETYLISQHRERFEKWIDLALPPHDQIEKVRDKGRLASIAEKAGLRVPPTRRFADRPSSEELASLDMDMPAIVKIPRGAGGTGMELVEDRERLESAFTEIYDEHGELPLIQKVVEGRDICVTAICDQGEVHSMMTYLNRHKAGDSAPGSVRETIEATEAEEAARQLLSALSWHGVAQLDFMWDGESEPWLIEINPRLFGGVFQTMASGLDFPWILFNLAVGRPLPPKAEPEVGVRTATPVAGLVGILRDAIQDDGQDSSLFERLADAWEAGGKETQEGPFDRIVDFFHEAKDVLDPTERWRRIESLLEENQDNVSQLMFEDDPKAALGMLYPLSIFLKHGRLDGELLHGTASGQSEEKKEGGEPS